MKRFLTAFACVLAVILSQGLTAFGAEKTIVCCDADNDGILSAADAAMILQKALRSTFKTELEIENSNYAVYLDADCDGKLTAADAAIVLQKVLTGTYIMPIEKKFPQKEEQQMKLTVDGKALDVSWEDNESVAALKELVKDKPLTVQMSMYGGFEQVGSLGTSLPRNDVQTVTNAGDIVLYSGNQIVIFYGSNSWSYTRLGKVSDASADKMAELLGSKDVTITLSMGGK